MCNVNYASWLRDLIPSNALGGFFSRRLMFATVASIVFGLGASFFVDFWRTRNPGDGEVLGYSIALLFGAIFIGMASPVFMALAPEPAMQVPSGTRPSLTDNILNPLRDRNFRQLMNFLFFRGFTANLAIPSSRVYARAHRSAADGGDRAHGRQCSSPIYYSLGSGVRWWTGG